MIGIEDGGVVAEEDVVGVRTEYLLYETLLFWMIF